MATRISWNGISVTILLSLVVFAATLFCGVVADGEAVDKEKEKEKEYVLTLDHSNFTETVSKHEFIVVEFYAPWCGHCKRLAPEYEKAASVLSSHDSAIILAKVDANEEANRGLASEFKIQGFPTIKILRGGGKSVQEYQGPRDADGIVGYLKKQAGPASIEINSKEDAATIIDDKKFFIVGLFPAFSGEEFENFTALAEKLRSDYDFGHTLDFKLIQWGESVDKPTLRLLKPFDELFVDFQEFDISAMEKFIEEAVVPLVTTWNQDPDNHPYLNKFFENSNTKAMLFVNFSKDLDAFKSKYNDVAESYKGKGISFLIGDVEASQQAIEYFGLKNDQIPAIIVQKTDGEKYLQSDVEPNQIASWLKDFKDGKLKPFIKSEPIPEVNDEPVKVVVTDSLQDMVFKPKKNILLEFYAPWCGHCKMLAPVLEEVAISFENDAEVMIAKLDATANDIPRGIFDVQGFPTLYFKSASNKWLQYEGNRGKEDIIEFIQKNRDKPSQVDSAEADLTRSEETNSVKDEL